MGTRSLTKVFKLYQEVGKEGTQKEMLVNMYRQYDGYPSGHGLDLHAFLDGGELVNGIGTGQYNSKKVFNGAGCLAAQMIAHFKNGCGGFYLMSIKDKDCGQDYEYHIFADESRGRISVVCYENGYFTKTQRYVHKKKKLFEGSIEDFLTFVETPHQ